VNPAQSAATSARPANLAFGVVMVFLPGEVAPECTPSGAVHQSRSASVPDYGKAVYHPAMIALKWTAAALVRHHALRMKLF